MLSQLFENPEYLSQVTKIEKIRLTYGEHHEVTARLMGTWVKDSLADAGAHAHMELALDAGGPSLRVELEGPELNIMMVREGDRLVATVNGLSNCTNLPQPTEYLLLREELGIVRKDPVFERTLTAAAAHAYPSEG
jgi:hypothetical protein